MEIGRLRVGLRHVWGWSKASLGLVEYGVGLVQSIGLVLYGFIVGTPWCM